MTALSSAYVFDMLRETGRGGGTGFRWHFTPFPCLISTSLPSNPMQLKLLLQSTFLSLSSTALVPYIFFPTDSTPLTVHRDSNLPSDILQSSCFLPLLHAFSLIFNSCSPIPKGGNALDLDFSCPSPATDIIVTPLHSSDHHLLYFITLPILTNHLSVFLSHSRKPPLSPFPP